jgi:hypothetical protein
VGAIESAIPKAGTADDARLLAIDAVVLARYVIDSAHPWWRRRPCALALRGRVPEALLPRLVERIRDPGDTTEVRVALLSVLDDRAELLPWLQAQTAWQPHGFYEAILKTRAALGDLTAVNALATLAAEPWRHRQQTGEEALERLVAHHGLPAVERELGERTEDRLFINRMRSREGADLTPAFADPDVGVARAACELVIETGVPDDEMLLDHVVTGPTEDARLWAAYALSRRGRDIVELWQALDRPRVEVPGLPEDVRLAILREYPGQPRTDPRWLVEQTCVALPEPPDQDSQLARAIAALDAAGLAPQPPRSIGEINAQGDGTYHVIDLAVSAVSVSTLGAFVTGDQSLTHVREVLERAGFRWLDETLARTTVTGLPVYYFGSRDPLDVRTLLFYWQD